jgi:histidinol dehydrogenase
VRIIRGADEGRRTLLKRQPLGETELPEAIRTKNAELFGADLSVEQQVRRIIADVARDGDAALTHYTKAFTGADVTSFEVPRTDIEAAYGHGERRHSASRRITAASASTRRARSVTTASACRCAPSSAWVCTCPRVPALSIRRRC